MFRQTVVWLVLVSLGGIGGVAPTWAAEHGAKGIFYSGEGPTVMAQPQEQPSAKKPQTPADQGRKEPYLGISYWIELVSRDGMKQRVTADRTFRSGDRIKLLLVANRDGYLYLLNIGSTGRSYMLFPHSGMSPGDNFIRASATYEIPYSATIRFDENPGQETLLLMLSPKPMGDLPPGPDPRTPTLNAEDTGRLVAAAERRGAKDLVLETESVGSSPASYGVAPLSSMGEEGMITLQIKLKHR